MLQEDTMLEKDLEFEEYLDQEEYSTAQEDPMVIMVEYGYRFLPKNKKVSLEWRVVHRATTQVTSEEQFIQFIKETNKEWQSLNQKELHLSDDCTFQLINYSVRPEINIIFPAEYGLPTKEFLLEKINNEKTQNSWYDETSDKPYHLVNLMKGKRWG